MKSCLNWVLTGVPELQETGPGRKSMSLADQESVCQVSACANVHATLHLEVLCHA